MANQVKLTFAGDSKGLEQTFDSVGSSSKKMADNVGESASGFTKAGEAADEVDTKAMGFRDTLTGVQDTLKGTSMIMKGPSIDGFVTLGAGIGDLGSGFYNFLIPALEKTKLATLASAGASKVAAAASKVWAAAQWLMNTALFASPVTWIIVGIIALIAIIVLIAKKTDWFSKGWRAAWSWIKTAASNTWEFIKKIPGWVGSAFSKISTSISAPFKAAFNAVSRAWNNTVGRLSWSVPGWVPGIGGNSISVPNLPTFHSGGVVPGVTGSPTVALLQGGERVSSIADAARGDGAWVEVRGNGLIDALTNAIADRVGSRGGSAAVLGIKLA